MTNGHRKERGRKEMYPSSKQALAGKKVRTEWILLRSFLFVETNRDRHTERTGTHRSFQKFDVSLCGSFTYTSRESQPSFFMWEIFLVHSVLASFFMWEISLTHFMLASFFIYAEFLLCSPCWLPFYVRSFSYISHAGFFSMWVVSLTHPVLASFSCREFLSNILCWFDFYVGSFSYISRAGFSLCGELLCSGIYYGDNP